jgi:hypothetical protein
LKILRAFCKNKIKAQNRLYFNEVRTEQPFHLWMKNYCIFLFSNIVKESLTSYKAVEENFFFFLFYCWTNLLNPFWANTRKYGLNLCTHDRNSMGWAGLRLALFLDHFFSHPTFYRSPPEITKIHSLLLNM